MKSTNWKIIMVGDFNDCTSCGEPCGNVWFVEAKFDNETGRPVCLNTVNTPEGRMISPVDNHNWTPKHRARENVQAKVEEFFKASKGPLYKLKDFCKGGAFEEGIYQEKLRENQLHARVGLPTDSPEVPEKILWPNSGV